jgi:hypothetical protein
MPDYLALQAGLLPYYYLLASCFAPRCAGPALTPFDAATSGPIALVAGRSRADSTCCVYRRLARRMSE